MRIEIICTGDEILTGKIVNTNFSYISQKLGDFGLPVSWETTVGDEREELLRAFELAAQRADAVIVNGGLGPTVDDLSQEIAARAAAVELVLHQEWMERMAAFFQRRGRDMPANNRKQAMLPAGSEFIDNPVGTACGFALDIGKARFFFTPGVPRELRRMLEEQIIPRLLARSGKNAAIVLKRFHTYGIGESHADAMLQGLEAFSHGADIKLGFRAHYPQLEIKLTASGDDVAQVRAGLEPMVGEVRQRLGNFIVAEDDQSLESVVLDILRRKNATLALAESFTGGEIAARIAHLPEAETAFRQGFVARDLGVLCAAVGMTAAHAAAAISPETAGAIATAACTRSGASHALAVLCQQDSGANQGEFTATVCLAIAGEHGIATRRSRIVGGRDWVRLGAVEMGLDSLRRYLQGLPVSERVALEKA